MKAFVLVEVEAGNKTAKEAISNIDTVVSADMVTGPYDIIATIEGTPEEVEGVAEAISEVLGVTRVVPCFCPGV